jgi:hypothetical protein
MTGYAFWPYRQKVYPVVFERVMKKTGVFGKIVAICCVLFLFSAISCFAAPFLQWDRVLSFLQDRFPAVYEPVGQVEQIHEDRIVFQLNEHQNAPQRGMELLITSHEDGIPVYLQSPSTLIKAVSAFNNRILATRTMQLEKKCKIGDTVVIPASPALYLYTNILSKDTFPPYRNLLENLISQNFEVVELMKPQITEPPSRYGVLLRLEASEGYLVSKIQSLYSGNTLHTMAVEYAGDVAISQPNGTPVILMTKNEPASPATTFSGSPQPSQKEMRTAQNEETRSSAATGIPSEKPSFTTISEPPPPDNFFALNDAYKRFVPVRLNENQSAFVLLNNNGITAFRTEDSSLQLLDEFHFQQETIIALHLHSIDLDGDGRDEILATLVDKKKDMETADSRLCSMILTLEKYHFKVLSKEIPYYLRAIEDREGRKIVIGQSKGTYDPYEGPIFTMQYHSADSTFQPEAPYPPADEIYSVYQFNLHPADASRVLIIEPTDYIYGYYTPTESVEAEAPRNYGKYNEIGYPQRLEKERYNRGEFDIGTSATVYAPRRFILKNVYDQQCFLIKKHRKAEDNLGISLKNLLGQTRNEDSLVAVVWRNKNIEETWESERIGKDILDFGFLDEQIYILSRNSMGKYAIEAIQ